MLVMIDNYDSFTYNIVQYLGELGAEVVVVRNDAMSLAELRALNPERLVISPGPCAPDQAGISLAAIQAFAGEIPILGVCLGHQAIGQAFGAKVVRAPQVMHGKMSRIRHADVGLFQGLPQDFSVTRYHSLVLAPESLPDCLEMTAWTEQENGTLEAIMGIRHRSLAVEGVQFHPESIMSEQGYALLEQFLAREIAA
jgi:anthranilate synthase component 2